MLVTGGNGTIGKRVCERLRADGVRVLAPRSAELDVLDTRAVDAYLDLHRPAAVVHIAWIPVVRDFWNDPDNIDWTAASLHLAAAAARCGARRFVGAGTCAEPPTPQADSFYGRAKAAVRDVLLAWERASTMRVLWGRIYYAYAEDIPANKLFRAAAASFARGAEFTVGRPADRYDWIHADDVAAALLTMLATGAPGSYDIGWGNAPATLDVIKQMHALMGNSGTIACAPATGPAREVIAQSQPLRDLGWEPHVSLADGLGRIAAVAQR